MDTKILREKMVRQQLIPRGINDKNVIAPRQWFGTDGYTKDHDTKDVTPDGWTRI